MSKRHIGCWCKKAESTVEHRQLQCSSLHFWQTKLSQKKWYRERKVLAKILHSPKSTQRRLCSVRSYHNTHFERQCNMHASLAAKQAVGFPKHIHKQCFFPKGNYSWFRKPSEMKPQQHWKNFNHIEQKLSNYKPTMSFHICQKHMPELCVSAILAAIVLGAYWQPTSAP